MVPLPSLPSAGKVIQWSRSRIQVKPEMGGRMRSRLLLLSLAIAAKLLSNTTYYFLMKVGDAVPNWSSLSNSAHATTSGTTPADRGMVLILPGTFAMGSPAHEPGRFEDETRHQVTLTKAFYLCDHTVTQQEWQVVMGWNESYFKGASLPVESVTWYDCL